MNRSDTTIVIATFIGFSLLFILVGIVSIFKKRNTEEDYLLASRSLSPWLVGLSGTATSHSGMVFSGIAGFSFVFGFSAIWLPLGIAFGDYLAWLLFLRRFREKSGDLNSNTVSDFLGRGIAGGRMLITISALITIVFLLPYGAAQMVASGKVLYAILGWEYNIGILFTAVIIAFYCFSGGIRASIWTDTVQVITMILAMFTLFVIALYACGGVSGLVEQLGAEDKQLVSFGSDRLIWGTGLFFLGWLAGGIGIIGQPQVVVRAMAIKDPSKMKLASHIKFVTAFSLTFMSTIIGLMARVLLTDAGVSNDPELAISLLAIELLPAPLVGLILAGALAACISTADSLVLSCSAALSNDLFPKQKKSYAWLKVNTLGVTFLAMIIALTISKNVFLLVNLSFSALGAGLGPIIILRIFNRPYSATLALLMMFVGVTTVILWKFVFQLSAGLYEILPGMLSGFVVYALWQVFTRHASVRPIARNTIK